MRGEKTLDIPTTISRLEYLYIMFIAGFLWGKYDISWEDYIMENTFLVSGRGVACQQEISLVLAKTPPIHF